MSTYFSNDNYYKAIITKGGNHIVISDEPGKECISLHDKDRKNHIIMSLDGGSHINVKSQGSINLDAGTINMSAKKINMKATEEWKVDVKKGEINSETDMIIKAQKEMKTTGGTGFSTDSNGDVTIKGINVTVDATANATVKGGAQLQLQGGGQASLKGGVVRIN